MRKEDLQPGDILFFRDALGNPIHVASYVGKRANTHFIVHAVTERYDSIMITRLKKDDFPYQVFRLKNNLALATQMATLMIMWAKNRVPFSHRKHALHDHIIDMVGNAHPKTGGDAQCQLAQSYFASTFYQYIEMAAHPQLPYFPHANGQMEGLYCSEAITAALNVAQLLLIDAVKKCKQIDVSWVSDSFDPSQMNSMSRQHLAAFEPSPRYFAYLENRFKGNLYPFAPEHLQPKVTLESFAPSITAWNYASYGKIETFVSEYKQFVLPLDAKITCPRAMQSYFLHHPDIWEDCGLLTVTEEKYPLQELEKISEEWRKYVGALFEDGEKKQAHVRQNCSVSLDEPIFTQLHQPPRPRSISQGEAPPFPTLSEQYQYHTQLAFYKTAFPHTSPEKPPKPSLTPTFNSTKIRPIKLNFENDERSEDKTASIKPSGCAFL